MNNPKFQMGDEVICIDDQDSDLDLLGSYIVSGVAHDGVDVTEYYLVGEKHSWMESRFEDYNTWASHQKPVDDKTELEQCKIQIASLQANKAEITKALADWEENAQYLLGSYPKSVRSKYKGGPENLMESMCITFIGMRAEVTEQTKREEKLVAALKHVADNWLGQPSDYAQQALEELGLNC